MATSLLVAFDVDDTLIVPAAITGMDRDTPSYETIAVYRWFQTQGHSMVIWSGGGADYARDWAGRLGLVADHYLDKHWPYVLRGETQFLIRPDLAFDDQEVRMGTVNVQVTR